MQFKEVKKQDACNLLKSAFLKMIGGDYHESNKDEDWSHYNWIDQIEEYGPHSFVIQSGGHRFRVTVSKPQ